MQISWMMLAEGIAQDAKGAFSLIGVNQNIIFVDSIPSQTKRAVLVHLEAAAGEGVADLSSATFTFTVTAPSGVVIGAQSGQIEAGDLPFPDLPSTADVPFDSVIPIAEPGEYTVGFRITYSTGRTDQSAISLFVFGSAENPQFKRYKEVAEP